MGNEAAASRMELEHHVQVSQERSDRLDSRLDAMDIRIRQVETTIASGFSEVRTDLASTFRAVKLFGSFLSIALTVIGIALSAYFASKK